MEIPRGYVIQIQKNRPAFQLIAEAGVGISTGSGAEYGDGRCLLRLCAPQLIAKKDN
jgi:hypothetical protein